MGEFVRTKPCYGYVLLALKMEQWERRDLLVENKEDTTQDESDRNENPSNDNQSTRNSTKFHNCISESKNLREKKYLETISYQKMG